MLDGDCLDAFSLRDLRGGSEGGAKRRITGGSGFCLLNLGTMVKGLSQARPLSGFENLQQSHLGRHLGRFRGETYDSRVRYDVAWPKEGRGSVAAEGENEEEEKEGGLSEAQVRHSLSTVRNRTRVRVNLEGL